MTAYDDIKAHLQQTLSGAEGIGADILFDFGKSGALLVKGRGPTMAIAEGRGSADCEIVMDVSVFQRMMRGELDETAAFMQGEMRLRGEIGLATRISGLIRARSVVRA